MNRRTSKTIEIGAINMADNEEQKCSVKICFKGHKLEKKRSKLGCEKSSWNGLTYWKCVCEYKLCNDCYNADTDENYEYHILDNGGQVRGPYNVDVIVTKYQKTEISSPFWFRKYNSDNTDWFRVTLPDLEWDAENYYYTNIHLISKLKQESGAICIIQPPETIRIDIDIFNIVAVLCMRRKGT
eukprot:261322_1